MSFISESTLPRMTPSLASIRWIVGTESPRSLGQTPLVEAGKGAGGAELCSSYHVSNMTLSGAALINPTRHMDQAAAVVRFDLDQGQAPGVRAIRR